MLTLLESLFANFSTDLLIAIVSSAASLVTAYIVMRERLLKIEVKLENVYEYIDNRNDLIDSKMKDLQEDIQDFKVLNKETTKSLAENTAAIQELKIVLKLVTEKLTKNN